jgi:trehalose-phosphatase
MKPLATHWTELRHRLARAPRLLLALDYDGVLAPIVRIAHRAKLAPAMRRVLRQLQRPGIHLAIVSGRGLGDLSQRVQLPGIILSGNHGLDIQFPGKRERRGAQQRFHQALLKARKELRHLAAAYPGTVVDDKKLGLSFNYQNVAPRQLASLLQQFSRWSRQKPLALRVTQQKKSFDIRPNLPWDKGSAVHRIWHYTGTNALPIFLGDDRTDEDAFRALRNRGITIFVGPKRRSRAEYYLPSQKNVLGFLNRLKDFHPHPPT